MIRYTFIQRLIRISIFLIFVSNTSLFAQDEGYFTISLDMLTDISSVSQQIQIKSSEETEASSIFFTASAEEEFTPKGKTSEGIPSYYRQHKTLAEDFTGFVIELLQSDVKLERDYPLFERFGNIHVEQLENGMYSYCIICNFTKSSKVKIFADEVIIPHAPNATVWKYKQGKRKKM